MDIKLLGVAVLAALSLSGCDFEMDGGESKAHNLYLQVEGTDLSALKDLTDMAVEKHNQYAMWRLGYIYERGSGGTPVDYDKSRIFYNNCELPACRYNLGLMLLEGKGGSGKKDAAAAIANFNKAAGGAKPSTGLAVAMTKLGVLYENGEVVRTNKPLAATWFERARNRNSVYADYRLGVIYATGEGRPLNRSKALLYLTNAANLWSIEAQYYLGKIHAEGVLVPVNAAEAGKWFLIAGSGSPEHKAAASSFIAGLTPKELKDATKRSENWLKAHTTHPEEIDLSAPIIAESSKLLLKNKL